MYFIFKDIGSYSSVVEIDLRNLFNLEVTENGTEYLNAFLASLPTTRYKTNLTIYVRDSYKSLYEVIKKDILKEDFELAVGLFTGVPGIGKSWFLIYFIYRYINDEKFSSQPFAVQLSCNNCILFTPNSSSGTYMMEVKREEVIAKKILLLTDLKEDQSSIFSGKWSLIFSSPNPIRYKEALKSDLSFRMILPTWSEEELLCVDPDSNKWYDNFVYCGGVPRNVFRDPADLRIAVEEAIRIKGPATVTQFFSFGHGDLDANTNYMIIHINPPGLEDDSDWNFRGEKVYSFASDIIFQKLTRDFDRKILNDAVNIFNRGVSSERYGAATAGLLFEKFCLYAYPLYNQVLKLQPLEQTTSDETQSNKMQSIYLQLPSEMEHLDRFFVDKKDLKPDIFYQPRISNLESGDAFCMIAVTENGRIAYKLIILQITVAEKHAVKINGLQKIIAAYPDEIATNIIEKALVFVTPKCGKLNSFQSYVNRDGKSPKQNIPKDIAEFKQYVVEYFFVLESRE